MTREDKLEVIWQQLQELEDEELKEVLDEWCNASGYTNYLCYMSGLDEEVGYYVRGNANPWQKSYYVYEFFRDSVRKQEFDIDDAYFAIGDDEIKSYTNVFDYVCETYPQICDYIVDNNDCLGNVDIENALKEMEKDD